MNHETHKCYKAITTPLTYYEAQALCYNMDAKLAEPKSYKDQNYLTHLITPYGTSYQYVWIGVHDLDKEGKFAYDSDSKEIGFSYWAPNEPDSNNADNEDAVVMVPYLSQWRECIYTKLIYFFAGLGSKI